MAKTLAELELCIPAIDDIQSRLLLGGTGYWEKTIELPEVPVSPQPERPDDPELPDNSDPEDQNDPNQDSDEDRDDFPQQSDDSNPLTPQQLLERYNGMLSEFFQGILNKITVEFGNLEGKSAQYNTETNVLTINSEGEFPMQTYIHELIHAWQDLQGYSERSTHASIEFETYVVSNIWAFL